MRAHRHDTMHQMRILQLVGRSQRRGAELVALELAPELDRLGHPNTVRACAPGFDGARDPALPPLSSHRTMRAIGLASAAWHLRNTLRHERYDVVLAHGGWAVQVATLARRRAGPLVVWQRILGFGAGISKPGRRRWWRLVVRRIDGAAALTPAMADEVRGLGFDGPVRIIPNFRDPERFVHVDRERAHRELRRDLGLASDIRLIGLVGHLIEQKRPERALDVVAQVHAAGEPVHLVVAGDGPRRDAFVAEALARNLDATVHMLGHRNDVEHVLGGIDVLILPSDAEGIPGIVIEALMAGCPVVTYPLGAVERVVEHGRTGIVVARAETTLMAAAVVELLRDPALRLRMGEEGRRRADSFSTRHAAKEYATLLEQLRTDGAAPH
jgi:glycosyltransferase involved in cell wall biosynthesis